MEGGHTQNIKTEVTPKKKRVHNYTQWSFQKTPFSFSFSSTFFFVLKERKKENGGLYSWKKTAGR